MSTTEFPIPGQGAGVDSEMGLRRATRIVLRNSQILCWTMMSFSIFAAAIAAAMAIVFLGEMIPLSRHNSARLMDAGRSLIFTLAAAASVPTLWRLGRTMTDYRVVLDGKGADFNLGTKDRPAHLFLPWDQISAVKRRRAGNVQQFWVEGRDGSEALFTSYTFFRPKRVARMIAERAGLTIEKL